MWIVRIRFSGREFIDFTSTLFTFSNQIYGHSVVPNVQKQAINLTAKKCQSVDFFQTSSNANHSLIPASIYSINSKITVTQRNLFLSHRIEG